MILSELCLFNFKSFDEARLKFSEKVNCITGKNGVGKTNILDAIHYLSVLRSHLSSNDLLAVKIGSEGALIEGIFTLDDSVSSDVRLAIAPQKPKKLIRDGNVTKRVADHIGLFPTVIISPKDMEIIHGTSEERRRFLDILISQKDKTYLEALICYNKVLKQRNNLLKDGVRDLTLFEIIEMQLADYGATISDFRRKALADFIPHFEKYYHEVSGGNEDITIFYKTQLDDPEPLSLQLRSNRERDYILGYTSRGVHRDDISLEMHHQPIRKIASEGQMKTALVALKFAQYDYMVDSLGKKPILLLDDLFDRLDEDRIHHIMSIVSNASFGQIFITDTNVSHLVGLIERHGVDHTLIEVVDHQAYNM